MNKLSDYIPLIVIMVSLILSAVGKKKKPGKITQETTLPGKMPGELIDKKKAPQTLADSYRQIVEDRPKKQVIRSGIREEIESFAPMDIALESEEENNPPFTFEEEDLRNAIIYAEIINKKEW
jgi:hypothetical protein